ncbi:hypothetical protein SAMN05444000_107140 [Shimia gijangensis]|uniref:Glycosyl transferase family 2 n=1 Tax=Shimia gijangensis TaxID=1470563 RepID=A0A1M6IJB0_9RHOB|nr:hypothetical protein [Shimia gijangensis]SHJ34541.1 hypothetical protein SAMN05444000_107140 [Shimia gijangensis]
MKYASVSAFLKNGKQHLAKGPVALVFAEDDVELDTTLRHHQQLGFKQVLVFMPDAFLLDETVSEEVVRIGFEATGSSEVVAAINQIIAAAPGVWLYYCFNAEYLFFPFCETRTIGEMLAFHTEERRDAMLTYVVDLYAENLTTHKNAVSLDAPLMDRSGYYALAREDATDNYKPKERQLDFYGGLRWRFEEHVPYERRKIDRISIFRAKSDLKLREDFTFNDEEYNTFSCEWHNSLTAAVCSFRTAKALKRNPGSQFEIKTFNWHNSVPFEWHSRQLLDLGLMEPGQWF